MRVAMAYDPITDFAPVTLVATQNLMLLVHPSVPVKSVKELVRLAKAQPGKLSFASAGNERLSKEGADPVGNSPQEFGKFIQSEIKKWRKVIRAAGIEPS